LIVVIGVLELAGKTAAAFAQEQPEALLTSAEQAVDADDYAKATDLLNRATAAARQSGNAEVQADIQEAKKRVGVLDREFKRLKTARDTLVRSPSDGPANMEVGRFYSFAKEDWEKGLKLLANGEEGMLRDAARMDLLQPKPREDQVLLGDKWVAEANESRDGKAKEAMHLRARRWYLGALAQCETDTQRTAIAERLDRLPLYPTKIIIWNTHNGASNDRGTQACNLVLRQQDRVVSTRRLTLPWKREVSTSTVVRLPRTQFDQVRIEIVSWQQEGGAWRRSKCMPGRQTWRKALS
jgi:hypothetical protein